MPASISTRRASVSFGIILSLSALAGLTWACLGWQGKSTKTVEKPVVKKTVVDKPVVEKPVTEKPVAKKPTVEKSVAPKPATAKPVAVKPSEKGTATVASSIEKLHPAKPVFLYVWDGYDNHSKTWEATGLYKSFVVTGIGKAVDKLLALVLANPESRAAWVHKLLMRSLVKGASLSVAVEKVSDIPAVQATFVIHGAADFSKELDELFAGPLQPIGPKIETVSGRKVTRVTIPDLPGYEIGWWVEGEHLVIAGGMQGIEGAIDVATAKTANLAANSTYQKLRKSPEFDVASVQLIDCKALLDLVRDLDVPPLPGSSKTPVKVSELLQIAGVDKLGLLTARWGFKGEAIWTETDLDVPAPLTGIMGLYDQKPLTLQDLPALPASCEYFMLARHDLSKSYASVLKIAEVLAEKIAPDDAPPVADALKIVNDSLGIDLQADLMEPLGDTFALYVESSGIIPAGVFLLKLDNAKQIAGTLAKLEDRVKELHSDGEFQFRTKETSGRTLHVIALKDFPIVSPTWVIDQDWLVIGTTPQSVEAYLKRVDGKLPKWKPTAESTVAQKMLHEKFTTFYYADPRGLLKYGLGLAPTGIAMLEDQFTAAIRRRQADFGQKEDIPEFPVTPEDVPLAEDVTGPLFPNIGTCVVDATGIHWRNRNSIPGLLTAGLPGGTGLVESGLFLTLNGTLWFAVRSVHVEAQAPPAILQEAVPAEKN